MVSAAHAAATLNSLSLLGPTALFAAITGILLFSASIVAGWTENAFVLHRMDMKEFLPLATQVTRLVNEHTGLEVAHVVPVKRIPKTTSGKIQRHLLDEDYVNGVYAAELAELDSLRAAAEAAGGVKLTSTDIERKIKDICDAALERNIDVHDNLFEIGASSLKLIEIHEQIDRAWPGLVDLTELFDFPTIAELSRHLEGKLAEQGFR